VPIDPADRKFYTDPAAYDPDKALGTAPVTGVKAMSKPAVKQSVAADAAGRAAVIGESALEFSKQRQTVQAAVALHLGNRIPGMDFSSVVDPIADRFLEMTAGDPALTGALNSDVNALFALTDIEIAEKIMRGEPVSQFGDVFDAVAEVAWEVGATELAHQLELEQADAMSGTFEALTGSAAMELADMDLPDAPDLGIEGDRRRAGGEAVGGGLTRAQTFENLFDVPGAWSFSPSSGILAVTIGEGDREETIGIEARAGFDPKNHLDVMAEVVSAQADGRVAGGQLTPEHGRGAVQAIMDTAHSIGSFLENNPTARTSIDALWGGLTQQDVEDIEERRANRIRDEKGEITEESVRLASVIPLPEGMIIASIARAMMGDAEGELDSATALELAAEIVDENREEMLTDFRAMTSEEILTELEAEAEGRSALGEAVETGLGKTLEVFEAWDMFSQTLGVAAIDAWKDIFGAGGEFVGGDWEEGFTRLQQVFEAPGETDAHREQVLGVNVMTAAEYFGLEGGAADAANLVVGGLFDPFNFVFPGAKGMRAVARKALTNPKYARVYMRMGSYPSAIKAIVGKSNLEDIAEGVIKGVTSPPLEKALAQSPVPFGTVDELAETGKVLYHGTSQTFDVFDASQAGFRGRTTGGQRAGQGGKFYFSDDPAVASAFADAGSPSSSLDELLGRNVDLEDLTVEDYDRLVDPEASLFLEIEDGPILIRSGEHLKEVVESTNWGLDEIGVRQLRPDRAPQVRVQAVFGRELDLSGFIDPGDLPAGLLDALQADRLVQRVDEGTYYRVFTPEGVKQPRATKRGFVLENWEAHEDRFEATAQWMRENGYGKAVVPDAMESGFRSYIGLEEYIGRDAAEVAERLGFRIGDEYPALSGGYVNPRGVKVASSMSGLDNIDMIDLVNLAMDPNATREQIEDVLIRGMGKDYLGEGPMRAQRHSTVEGVGRMLESIAGGKISDEHLGPLMQMLTKFSVGRTVRLGENQSLDVFADMLTQFFPRDADTYTRFFLDAVRRVSSAGDELALQGANQAMKESARRSLWESAGTRTAITGTDDLKAVGENLTAIEDALTKVDNLTADDAAKAAVREQLEQTHATMSRRYADAQVKLGRVADKRRVAHEQLGKAAYLEADVANAARNEMAGVIAELYEEIAQRLEAKFGEGILPVTKNVNPLAPEIPVRDWSAVTGVKRSVAGDDQDLRLWMGLAVDDVDMSRGLDAVGMFNRSQKVLLPASPYEVILYEKIAGNPNALAKVTNVLRGERVKKVVGGMKFAFAMNLLVNPVTAGKVTLDETLRFLADTGQVGKFTRATLAGIPAVGRGTESFAKSNFVQKFTKSMPNPYAQQYRRNVGGWSADDYSNYDWVKNPGRRAGSPGFKQADFREQAERWVNGTLLQDTRFREYARWIDEAQILEDGTKIAPQGFIDWWDNGAGTGRPGKAEARQTKVTIRESVKMGTELTANEAFGIIDNAFEHWIELLVKPNQRNAMRRALRKAATSEGGRLDVVKDASLLNAIEQVPGLSGKTGPGTSIFNTFFGAPSGRRAGVFFEHYFDEAMDILRTRHGSKVLTAETVADYAKKPIEEAQFMLKQGMDNQTVSHLVRQTGAKLESQIQARAAAYAERRADDLMYRFTASSLAGRGVEAGLMFPFARAQMDFLSWWSDHLTKPMTLRIPLEARAKFPRINQALSQTVERIPINARAFGKFSHLVAGVNNEHDSFLDQTIDNLTFFPFHFDQEFLLDVSPQFGALPSWMFDLMVDKGMFDDETIDAFETLFPALGFTEVGEGGVLEEMFDRVIPTSRRSLRDLAGSASRLGYTFFGEDVHTDTGLGASLTNIVLDGKVPSATGDFQVSMISDFFKEDLDGEASIWALVPGSDEFNQRIGEIAVKGAIEANRQEWNQDLRDRVFPLTGYDAEYRALRAYEGLFDEEVFASMSSAGIFQQNDLLDVEGQPRIKAIWDSYLEGTAAPDDLEFLRDRLTTAYFEAGRREVYPGFSFMDYLHLIHPEIAVNLIGKTEDSGIPVRSDDHAEFKNTYISALTGRTQNVPPGPEGSELMSDARKNGWIVSRPVEEWAFDAAAAVYKSGARAVHGVWEWISYKPWSGRISESLAAKSFVLGENEAKVLAAAGMDLTAGTELTYGEFHSLIGDFDERFKVAQPVLLNTLQNGAVHGQLAKHGDAFGTGLLDDLGEADKYFQDQGIESMEDWPEETLAEIRSRFTEAINLGYTTLADYRQEIEPIFGPIDYTPPVPPPVADLESGIQVAGDDLNDLAVIDGDTVSILLEDGPMRVRFVGLNAPEVTQPGYSEAREQLARVVAGAEEITLGIYRPELFGLTQLSAPGERRLLAWLYIDGVPIWDPSVFSADNPRGAGTGGRVLDLEAILAEGQS
jgi:hypothetical protein